MGRWDVDSGRWYPTVNPSVSDPLGRREIKMRSKLVSRQADSVCWPLAIAQFEGSVFVAILRPGLRIKASTRCWLTDTQNAAQPPSVRRSLAIPQRNTESGGVPAWRGTGGVACSLFRKQGSLCGESPWDTLRHANVPVHLHACGCLSSICETTVGTFNHHG